MYEKAYCKYTKVVCPQCGKILPVRILDLNGRIKFSVKCRSCGKVSEIAIEDSK